MVNFVTFFFVFTAPFVFPVDYMYLTPVPSAILALTYFGVSKIGEAIEKPFNWTYPNHELSGVGWRIHKENSTIHKKMMTQQNKGSFTPPNAPTLQYNSPPLKAIKQTVAARMEWLAYRFRERQDELEKQVLFPNHPFSFLTEVFAISSTVVPRVTLQMIVAACFGIIAQVAKLYYPVGCGPDISFAYECDAVLDTEAHTVTGAILGFLLVFRANLSYSKFYEAKEALGLVYDGIRNCNVSFASFMRQSRDGELGRNYSKEERARRQVMIQNDSKELLRLSSILYAFIRQAIRDQRHGVKGNGKVDDYVLLSTDESGDPSLGDLLTSRDIVIYKSVDFNNRANVTMAQIQRIIEKHRRMGHM